MQLALYVANTQVDLSQSHSRALSLLLVTIANKCPNLHFMGVHDQQLPETIASELVQRVVDMKCHSMAKPVEMLLRMGLGYKLYVRYSQCEGPMLRDLDQIDFTTAVFHHKNIEIKTAAMAWAVAVKNTFDRFNNSLIE